MTTKRHITSDALVTFVLAALLFFSPPYRISAQAAGSDEVLFVADEMPSFPGGQKALMEALWKNITYPADAMEKGIQGKVIVRFVVTKEGKAIQPTISKGLYPSIDNEVLKAINKIPAFLPGKVAGKPVSVWYAVPITFKLAEG
jgi:TonB family protein